MKKNSNWLSIMLFVLALSLLAIGIGLATVTQQVTRYRYYYGFKIPYTETIYPYQGVSVQMIIFAIIVLIIAFVPIKREKEMSGEETEIVSTEAEVHCDNVKCPIYKDGYCRLSAEEALRCALRGNRTL